MGPRQETIDESIVPLRIGRKRGKQKGTSQGFQFNPIRNLSAVGYFLLAFFSFLVFFLTSLPLERMSNHILQIASTSTQMNWDAQEVDISVLFGPKITFKKLLISPRDTGMENDPLANFMGDGLMIDRLSFRPSLWELIPIFGLKESRPAGSFSADFYGAEIDGSFAVGRNALDLSLSAEDLDFKKVPQLSAQLNMEGKINDLQLTLNAPRSRLGAANGELSLHADTLKIDPTAFSQMDFVKELGLINLGKLDVRSRIRNGQLLLNEFQISGKGSDLEVRVEGDIKLNDNIAASDLNIILWLTPSAKLDRFFPLLSSILRMEKNPNNSYASSIRGNFLRPEFSPYKGG